MRLLSPLRGEQLKHIARADVVRALVFLLRAVPAGETATHAALVLSGMAAYSGKLCRKLLKAGALPLLVRELDQHPASSAQLRSAVELLQLHEQCMAIDDVAVRACAMLLSEHASVQTEAVWALCQLAIPSGPSIQQVIDAPGVLQRLVHFLGASHNVDLKVSTHAHEQVASFTQSFVKARGNLGCDHSLVAPGV